MIIGSAAWAGNDGEHSAAIARDANVRKRMVLPLFLSTSRLSHEIGAWLGFWI